MVILFAVCLLSAALSVAVSVVVSVGGGLVVVEVSVSPLMALMVSHSIEQNSLLGRQQVLTVIPLMALMVSHSIEQNSLLGRQ
jgi:hypothetical protein